MRLHRTKKHWDEFARTDPFWAVLTDDNKKGNRWQIDEFFATGVRTVDAELQNVRAHCPDLRLGTALDFGCGVGRLSQALARHFDRVTGVDISVEMIGHAQRHNRHGDRVRYVHNSADNLRLFPDGEFDFVYSLITLQHMEPVYARRYIAEFVRVTAPGGVILFQLPVVAAEKRRPFTLWPDTLLKRVVRDLKRALSPEPRMEMHAIPRAEVEALLASAGARIVHSYRYDAAGAELPSWGYLAVKTTFPAES